MSILSKDELTYLQARLSRAPNDVEKDIVGAEWSEHCSYKSSKKFVRLLPTKGERILVGPGYDAGVLDVGDGYVVTIHIESHNHPSAVEPFGGAATGVGGVLRDILSMGTRPIAVLDALRFAPFQDNGKKQTPSPRSKWLFKNVVRGIADYGNCMGIPTVGGEVEFDQSFQDYCLVDVASVGFGRKDQIVKNRADAGDFIVLAGGSTGRDGIHGASFASKALEEDNRSAVQIPDPFLEKLLLEATMEAVQQGCVKCMKDLGGGGLACCLSETSDNLGKGFDVELSTIHKKEEGMSAAELMISESQERMLYITDSAGLEALKAILDKYEIRYAVLGKVMDHKDLVIRLDGKVVASMPSHLVAHAPLLDRPSKRPLYLDRLKSVKAPSVPRNLGPVLLSMLSNPNICSRGWIYGQYDHEVGIRTVVKPGGGNASVLRLDNGRFLSVKVDGNSKHCYLDPYQGTLGCLSEGRRNVVCTGADPIGIVDHMQFGSPEDPEIFWTFEQSINAVIEFCKFNNVPVVGGKVSLYNEASRGSIKPSPIIGTIGLIEQQSWISRPALGEGDAIFIVGQTDDDMGGSEYYEYCCGITGGKVPTVDLGKDKMNADAVLGAIKTGKTVDCIHDCSKGGLATALSEMAMWGGTGFKVNLDKVPTSCTRVDNLLFSESHSRYIIGTKDPERLQSELGKTQNLCFAEIGRASGKSAVFQKRDKPIVQIPVSKMSKAFASLEAAMTKTYRQ